MTRSKKLRPPLWLCILWGILLLAILGLWFGDAGDLGMRNVGSMASMFVATGLGLVWFTLMSGHPVKLRVGVAAAVLGLMVISNLCFRLEGFSGSMIPKLRWRASGGEVFHGSDSVGGERIDLTPGPGDFPGFLGAARNLRVELGQGVQLRSDWDTRPPRILWNRAVGAGWSGFAVVNGFAFTLEQWDEQEVSTAYEMASGELLWSSAHPGRFENFLGGIGPRSTPLVHRGRVYTLGAGGRFACHAGRTGELLWEHDLLEMFGVTPELEAKNILYGRSNSPLAIVTAKEVEGAANDLVVIPAGGDATTRMAGLVAFDAVSGERVWESPPRQISFSSPLLATLAGVDQIVIVNEDTVTGHDPHDGSILWEESWPGITSQNACVSQATLVSENRVMFSKGYGGGSMLIEIRPAGDALETHLVWKNRRSMRTKLTSPVVHAGYAYGLADERLECVDLETGERVWREGRYGHGQILLVGESLFILSEWGELSLVEPTPEQPNRVLGRVQALAGKCWNTLAFYDGKILLRSDVEAVCVEVGREE